MIDKTPIIRYQQLLTELKESDQECHLLLGNGFNNSLGVNTSYKGIFERMKRDYAGYEPLESYLSENYYDIEKLIHKLKDGVVSIEGISDGFLPDFIESKVKLDFMKAAYEIVKEEIKNIYHEEKSEGIYLLFNNFTNYFSLNYDPFLYLILMKFKKADGESQAIALQQTTLFKEQDLDSTQDNIYSEIEKARREGMLQITIGDSDSSEKSLKNITKNYFQETIKTHFKDKGWKSKDIERVCDHIWEKESHEEKLDNINDSFFGEDYKPESASLQNIFFLHGAFHIYQKKTLIRKITQKQNKALYQRLEDIINSEEEDIICVLTGTSEEKSAAIQANEYLNNNLTKLSSLHGSLVVFGSSLDENDKHIFNQINQSNIKTIYISSTQDKIKSDAKKAKLAFPKKQLQFFDYKTVSYELGSNGEVV